MEVDLIKQFFRHLDFATFEYANLTNLLHPGFQGVRWTRDQPMPGSFPPVTFKGKVLGTRLFPPPHPESVQTATCSYADVITKFS